MNDDENETETRTALYTAIEAALELTFAEMLVFQSQLSDHMLACWRHGQAQHDQQNGPVRRSGVNPSGP